MSLTLPLPPGSTIGILGGGQLGRMLAMAASQLGYRSIAYAPPGDNVAADVCAGFPARLLAANREDRRAWELNGLRPPLSLALLKPLRKVKQWLRAWR